MDDCTHDIITLQREAHVRRTLERRRPGPIHQASSRDRTADAVRRLADAVDSRPAGTTAPTRPM